MALRCGESILTSPVTPLGNSNTLLLARARRHSVSDFAGPLSIKHVTHGRAAWKTGNRQVWVDDSSFLILNHGEPYSLSIDEPDEIETCCVFFASGFVESIARCLVNSERQLLDDPLGKPLTLPFISRLHQSDSHLMHTLAAVRQRAFHGFTGSELEEEFLLLGRQLLTLYEEMRVRLTRVPAARASTRFELLKRLERGREFLHDDPTRKVDLAQIASAACLSPYHFHRAFTRAFSQTPQFYLSSLRLNRAARLLQCGMPVTQTCFAVGFESLGSFSSLFRRRFGQPPSKFRKIR